jgi:hypothetical protein
MRQITITAFLGMLALTITGCPSSNDPQTVNPTPSTAPVVQTPPVVKPPLVAQNPSTPTSLAPGLIQPTNANQRTKQVAKGNRDPFTALFLPIPAPPISTGNTASVPTQAPQVVGSPTVNSGQTTRTQTSKTVNNKQSRPSSVAINNPRTAPNPRNSTPSNTVATSPQNIPSPPSGTLPNNNLQPAPPPAIPEPELARNVTVMGVIQIGEQAQAIVQVPSEPTSRYVQVGQSLSNGQVLVKRIELNAGAEPLVVLEQYGVEVSKAVGEVAPNKGDSTTPTAAVPTSPQDVNPPTAAVPYLPAQNTNTPTAAIPAPPPQNINAPTAVAPYSPAQNTNAPTAAIPAPSPQNINNISGINLSGAQPLPSVPSTLTK